MNTEPLYPYLVDGLNLLSAALNSYREGERAAYRVAAVELRLLLCDTTRIHNQPVDISLAARLYPYLSLFPPFYDHPGFNLQGQPLPRAAWLMEKVSLADGSVWTIRDMIRWVCDRDGGAHVDPQTDHPSADIVDWIMAIGGYVRNALMETGK